MTIAGGDRSTAVDRASAGSALLLPAGAIRDIETRGGAHWLSVGHAKHHKGKSTCAGNFGLTPDDVIVTHTKARESLFLRSGFTS